MKNERDLSNRKRGKFCVDKNKFLENSRLSGKYLFTEKK